MRTTHVSKTSPHYPNDQTLFGMCEKFADAHAPTDNGQRCRMAMAGKSPGAESSTLRDGVALTTAATTPVHAWGAWLIHLGVVGPIRAAQAHQRSFRQIPDAPLGSVIYDW